MRIKVLLSFHVTKSTGSYCLVVPAPKVVLLFSEHNGNWKCKADLDSVLYLHRQSREEKLKNALCSVSSLGHNVFTWCIRTIWICVICYSSLFSRNCCDKASSFQSDFNLHVLYCMHAQHKTCEETRSHFWDIQLIFNSSSAAAPRTTLKTTL